MGRYNLAKLAIFRCHQYNLVIIISVHLIISGVYKVELLHRTIYKYQLHNKTRKSTKFHSDIT